MSLESAVEWHYSHTLGSEDPLPHSSLSSSQPPFLHFWNPLCGISSVFFIRLLQLYKLPATSVAIMRTLERDGKSRSDGENTRWVQPRCKSGEYMCVCLTSPLSYEKSGCLERVCVCVCVCVCTCLNLGKHIYMCTPASLCTSWMWVALCVCVFAWRRKEENRINQHVSAVGVQRHEAARFRLFSPLMCFDSVGEIKKYRCGNQEQVALRQVTVRHLTAETPKKRRRGGREWKRDGGLRRRSSVFACGGGRRLMLAGILDVICVQL